MIDIQNKKIAVTGAGSMINSSIVRKLKERGAIVDPIYHSETNLLFEKSVNDRFDKFKPDYVIHGAGFNGGISFNKSLPLTIHYRTVTMAMNVINSAASHGVKKLVSLLTSCAYPAKDGFLKEEDFLKGECHESVECHGYGKRTLFIHGKQAYKQYGLKCLGVIFNNCYGPGDVFNDNNKLKVCGALIKKFVDAKQKDSPDVLIWGTGKPRRELLYSEDAAEGAIRVLESYEDITLPINIGWGTDQSIVELAEKIRLLIEYNGNVIYDKNRPDGQMQKLLDVSRMKEILNWQPEIDLDTGLKKTIEYYENWVADNKMMESNR